MPDHPYREGAELTQSIVVTTGNDVAGHRVDRYLGLVRGIVVRSPSIGQNFFGGLKMITGGDNKAFAEVCEAARHEAYQRMLTHAQEIGAQAIIGARYDATEFAPQVTEVLAYGTAVTLERV